MGGAKTFQLVAAGTSIGTAVEGTIGDEIDVTYEDTLALYIDYTAGTETAFYLYPKFLHTSEGTAYQWQDWTAVAGDKIVVTNRLSLTTTGNYVAVWNVTGLKYVQFYTLAAGSITGTVALTAIVSAKAAG